MGFDLAGMGEVAQGMSDMRTQQQQQLQAQQIAEENAVKLRSLQQAEGNRNAAAADMRASFANNQQQPRTFTDTSLAPMAPLPVAATPAAPSLPTASLPYGAPAIHSMDNTANATPQAPTYSTWSAPAQAPVAQPAAMPAFFNNTSNPQTGTSISDDVTAGYKAAIPQLLAKSQRGEPLTPQEKQILSTATPSAYQTNEQKFAQLRGRGFALPAAPNTSPVATLPSRPFSPTPTPDVLPAALHISAGVQKWVSTITEAANKYGVDPRVLTSLAQTENSAGNPALKSSDPRSTATGLFQVNNATARQYGVSDVTDPAENADGAAKMMQQSLATFGGDYAKAVAAHHYGIQGVKNAITAAGLSGDWINSLKDKGARKYIADTLSRANMASQDTTASASPNAASSSTPLKTSVHGFPVPATIAPTPADPAPVQDAKLDAGKVYDVVASNSTPARDDERNQKLAYINLRMQHTTDPEEMQGLATQRSQLRQEKDEVDILHAYVGASNGDQAGMRALAGLYQEFNRTPIGITMQNGQMIAYTKGADGQPQVVYQGAPHDVASQIYAATSPIMRDKSIAISTAAATAMATKAPDIAIAKGNNVTKLQSSAITATGRVESSKIMANSRIATALAARGLNPAKSTIVAGKNPGDPTFAVVGNQFYRMVEGKSGHGVSSKDRLVAVDMSAVPQDVRAQAFKGSETTPAPATANDAMPGNEESADGDA